LQQALINLINNALDAMPAGGTLAIRSEREAALSGREACLVVTVADNGCGMSPQVQAHIFDPLYTTKERGKGAGLGLVVVNKVMQEHGGSVAVESAAGRGSRFTLKFPAAAPAAFATDREPRTTDNEIGVR
jgi:signal transduction histidine kinase